MLTLLLALVVLFLGGRRVLKVNRWDDVGWALIALAVIVLIDRFVRISTVSVSSLPFFS